MFLLILKGILYLLSSEEEKYISLDLLADVYLYDSPDGSFKVVPLWLRSVEDLHRVSTTRNTLAHVSAIIGQNIIEQTIYLIMYSVYDEHNNCVRTHQQWGIVKVVLKLASIKSGTHDDDL